MFYFKYKFQIILIIIIIFSKHSFCQSGWVNQSSGITTPINSVKFINSNTGICAGDNGVILKTTNGGTNWIQVMSGFKNDLHSVSIPSNNVMYMGGDSGLIIKTTNGGDNWNRLPLISYNNFLCVFFVNNSMGYSGGKYYDSFTELTPLYKTTNGGDTWDSSFTGASYLFSLHFINSLTGWMAKGFLFIGIEVVSKTTNGGVNWIDQLATSIPRRFVFFIDSLYGWSPGISTTIRSLIYRTINGGNNWIVQFPETWHYINSLYFINRNKGWAVGENKTIQFTTNGGINWINPPTIPSVTEYLSVYYTDSLTG